MEYRVALDIYKGPLDLLLYLIQENEVEITDVPIARITDQYLQYLGVIRMLDPNIAGDFLVMASTLMEIKSRMLLPKPETAAGAAETDDPRIELIRQLMEYKKFKEAAAMLAEKHEERLDRFPRGLRQTFDGGPGEDELRELSEVSIWDVLAAFDRVMRATLRFQPTTIVDRDVPIRQHIESILRTLRVQRMITFLNVFETCRDRLEAVGALLACLEMTRRKVVSLEQTADHSHIYIKLLDETAVPSLLAELVDEHKKHPAQPAASAEEKAPRLAGEAPAAEPVATPVEAPAAEGTAEDRADDRPDDLARAVEEARAAKLAAARTATEEGEEEAEEEAAEEGGQPDADLEEIRKIEIRDVDLREVEAAVPLPSAEVPASDSQTPAETAPAAEPPADVSPAEDEAASHPEANRREPDAPGAQP
jgi:segregation and condensation protein A